MAPQPNCNESLPCATYARERQAPIEFLEGDGMCVDDDQTDLLRILKARRMRFHNIITAEWGIAIEF